MKELTKKPKYHRINKTELVNIKFKRKKIITKKLKRFILILLNILFVIYFLIKLFHIFKKNIIINNNKANKDKNIKICLCSIGKKENLYAKEYVNHYQKIGYNHIYIYDNNDENGEKFEDVLRGNKF